MRATGYVSPITGELIELTANDKNIYVVMKKRNTFFDKHFDKQEDIAKLCGISVKQVGRIIRSFIDNGLMIANKGQSGQHKNWRYEKVLDIVLYVNDDGTQMLPEIPQDFWRSDVKQNKVVKEWSGRGQVPDKTPLKSTINPSLIQPYWEVDNDDSGPF